jgi:dihydrofolate synthase/folylpolyglutamate synthase
MVLSISAGKDLHRLLPILLAGANTLTVTRADPYRSADPEVIAACAAGCFPGLPVRTVADPLAAVRRTLAELSADALMCVTGSVYAAGAARAGLALALGSRG